MLLVILFVALVDFTNAVNSSQCFTQYQNITIVTCELQRSFAKCVLLAEGYFNRSRTPSDAVEFDKTFRRFIPNPEPNCSLDINSTARAVFTDYFYEMRRVLTKAVQSIAVPLAAGDLTPEECIDNFVDLTCTETVEFTRCYTLVLQIDFNKLSRVEFLQLEQEINSILANFTVTCTIDLQAITDGSPTPPETDMNTTAPKEVAPIPYPDCLSNSTSSCQGRLDGDYFVCFPDCKPGFYIACISEHLHARVCPYLAHDRDGSYIVQRYVFDPIKKRCQPFSAFCPRNVEQRSLV